MTTDRRRVVVVGLGTMGMPMATRLLQRGHQVTVVPHSSKASAQWLASQGALIADSPAAAVTMGADVVLLSLPSSESVAEVLNGPHGVFSARRGQLVIVDTSTIGPRAAQDMADRASAVDAHYLDCPISGGPSRAQTGTLTAIVGGDEHVIASTRDVVDCLASNVFVVGGVGAAQVVKICNNLILAACMLANAEALALADAAGIPLDLVREVVSASSGSNWQLENIVPKTILRDDYTALYALRLLLKDLGIAETAAHDLDVWSPMLDVLRQTYGTAAEQVDTNSDFSSVYRLYGRTAAGSSVSGPSNPSRNASSPPSELTDD